MEFQSSSFDFFMNFEIKSAHTRCTERILVKFCIKQTEVSTKGIVSSVHTGNTKDPFKSPCCLNNYTVSFIGLLLVEIYHEEAFQDLKTRSSVDVNQHSHHGGQESRSSL